MNRISPEVSASRSVTSNTAKLLHHLPELQAFQEGKQVVPPMFHMSICNPCNLTCSFCCYAGRVMKEILPVDKAKKAIDSFAALGTKGLELTGGGEPTLHRQFDDIVAHAHDTGLKIGVCTNGKDLRRVKSWDKIDWVRLGLYGPTEGYEPDLRVFDGLSIKVSAAYVWDQNTDTSQNPNLLKTNKIQTIGHFYEALDFVDKYQIPTRVAFNAIKSAEEVARDMNTIREQLANRPSRYAFLSDFNYQGTRRNDSCYMAHFKPFVYTDGNVYVCPSTILAPENGYAPKPEFKICDIEGIKDFYSQPSARRIHPCSYCKYAKQNELVDDVMTPIDFNEFL